MQKGELAADSDFISNVDRKNHWPGPETDADGRVTFEVLIPGATYRIFGTENGHLVVKKDFSVEAGRTLDLGEFVITEAKPP